MTDIDHKSRAHALLSASSAHRWLACPPSAVAAEAYPDQDSDYAAEGTTAHEVAEVVAGLQKASVDKWLDDARQGASAISPEMIECAMGYRDYIQEQITIAEPLIMLEQRVDFSPWVPDGFGTADCIIIQGDTMDVIDYKYGKGVAVSAVGNPQEMLYGLGALNDYGFAYEVEKVRLHIYQPRINNVSVFALGTEELMAWADGILKPVAELAAKGEGEYHAGDHCKFCPHAGRCRELTHTCTETINTHDITVALPVLAPHEVAAILEQEPLISLWLKRVREQALTSMLDGQKVPGYKVVAGRSTRKWADELETADTLKKAGYSLEDITKTELLSVAGMEKALGKKRVAELVGGHILTTSGAPTIAPETDKRPAYDPTSDFDKID